MFEDNSNQMKRKALKAYSTVYHDKRIIEKLIESNGETKSENELEIVKFAVKYYMNMVEDVSEYLILDDLLYSLNGIKGTMQK